MMLRRSTFTRPVYQPHRQPTRAVPALFRAPTRIDDQARPVPKEEPARHRGYRMLVAELPCAYCKKPGPSQCAHSDFGKGASLKSDDRNCFPLCPRCHDLIGQHALFCKEDRRRFERTAACATRLQIRAAGRWPKDLPWPE